MISTKQRFPKPTNRHINLKIFMEENTLKKKLLMAAPSVALFPKKTLSESGEKKNKVS